MKKSNFGIFAIESGAKHQNDLSRRILLRQDIKPRLYRVEAAAQYLGIAAKTIRNGIGPKAKRPFPIKPKRIGGRVLFDIKDLDAYIDKLNTT